MDNCEESKQFPTIKYSYQTNLKSVSTVIYSFILQYITKKPNRKLLHHYESRLKIKVQSSQHKYSGAFFGIKKFKLTDVNFPFDFYSPNCHAIKQFQEQSKLHSPGLSL